MAGESWKSHKITGTEDAWDRDHEDQLADLLADEDEDRS